MSMLKLIDVNSFYGHEEPTVSILNLDETKGMLKQAADSEIVKFASTIKPESDRIYIHVLALGAGEYYSSNRNGDYFPESNLIESHHTFVTSPAYIYRNHQNKDPAKSIGKVIFSCYNSRMHRVELIAYILRSVGQDVIDRIEVGDFPSSSMACRIKEDVCSICGNHASTRQYYCSHLREELGRQYPDGRKVMAMNLAPLKFIDQSIVVRPADVTSSVLQKLASAQPEVVGSAEMAELEGVTDSTLSKKASIKKLSEFIKQIEGDIVDHNVALDPILNKVKDPSLAVIDALVNYELAQVLESFAHMGINPSVSFLAELIARREHGPKFEGVGNLVASLVENTGLDKFSIPEIESANCSDSVNRLVSPYLPSSSYLPEFVEKRASGVGYIGNGPYIESTPYEKFKATNSLNASNESIGLIGMMKTLLAIGGAAIAAKIYIARAIEQKMKEQEVSSPQIKVVFIKQASSSDYRLAYKLAKNDLKRVLNF